jgi:hypothetical protein
MGFSKRSRRGSEKTFRLFDYSTTVFFKSRQAQGRRSLANRLEELDADQLDVASFLATLNLGLNRRHSRGNQG